MNRIAGATVLSAIVLGLASTAHAIPIVVSTTLSGPNESPPNASPGTGSVIVIYDSDAHTLGLNVTFSGLTSTDVAAHIHCCTAVPFTGTAGVATTVPAFVGFPLGVTLGTFNNLLNPYDLTQASFWNAPFLAAHGGTAAGAEAFFASGLQNGTEYFNIHTVNFPGGEIRGFLVPEPGTMAIFGVGLAWLGLTRRRRVRALA